MYSRVPTTGRLHLIYQSLDVKNGVLRPPFLPNGICQLSAPPSCPRLRLEGRPTSHLMEYLNPWVDKTVRGLHVIKISRSRAPLSRCSTFNVQSVPSRMFHEQLPT